MTARQWKARILATGEEITQGRSIDTNSAFIASRLAGIGVRTVGISACGDGLDEIVFSLNQSLANADLVIVGGGLGPTEDDRTAQAASLVFHKKLVCDDGTLAWLNERFARYGVIMTPNNAKQAWFPEGAGIVPNEKGTARGFWIEDDGRIAIFLPGVPRELIAMIDSWVLPFVAKRMGGPVAMRDLVFKIFGLTESAADQAMAGAALDPAKVRIGFLAKFPEVQVSLQIVAATAQEADEIAAKAKAEAEALIGPFVFSRDPETGMQHEVGKLLSAQSKTLALAESCTGGMIAAKITDVPGSSAYFLQGHVVYSNAAKVRALGVSEKTLKDHGAVSEECALEMARGARIGAGADIGLSVTGIAGPDGGTGEKPVGLVFIALDDGREAVARRFQFRGNRDWVRTLAAYTGLDMLRRSLMGDQSWKSGDFLSPWSSRKA